MHVGKICTLETVCHSQLILLGSIQIVGHTHHHFSWSWHLENLLGGICPEKLTGIFGINSQWQGFWLKWLNRIGNPKISAVGICSVKLVGIFGTNDQRAGFSQNDFKGLASQKSLGQNLLKKTRQDFRDK